MKVNPGNTNYQEFLSIISGIKTVEKHTMLINYEDEISGTIDELKELVKESGNIDLKRSIYEYSEKLKEEISDVEMKSYLKKFTDNFDKELIKTALSELEVFEALVFRELLDDVAKKKYLSMMWAIPMREWKDPVTKQVLELPDYGNMRGKVFPFVGMQLYRAEEFLRNSLKSQAEQNVKLKPKQEANRKPKQEAPKTFEELFYNPAHAEPCLKILNELKPPTIDAANNYIGKAKGIFPLWIRVLKNHKPNPLLKHFKDTVYKDLLNQKVKGLNLSKDASEFRKQYKRLENDKVDLDIKTILSQYSQNGKLGK